MNPDGIRYLSNGPEIRPLGPRCLRTAPTAPDSRIRWRARAYGPEAPSLPGGVRGQSWHHGWVSVCDQAGSPKRLRAQQVPLTATGGQGQGGQSHWPPHPRLQPHWDRRCCLHFPQTLGGQITGVSPRPTSGKLERTLGEGQHLLDWTALGTCVQSLCGAHREPHQLGVSTSARAAPPSRHVVCRTPLHS